ncbi:unnamed protein product [Musa acuminata var. zebrina]
MIRIAGAACGPIGTTSETGTGAATTELLGLAPAGIRDEKSSVVADEDVLDLLLGLLVDVLLVEGDEGLGDALADGVDLGGLPATADADADVDARKPLPAEEEDGLEGLQAEDLRLHQLDRDAVHLDQPAAALTVRHRHRRLLPAEALHRICRRRRCHRRRTNPDVTGDSTDLNPRHLIGVRYL